MTDWSAFLDFSNQYASSWKEPDLAITPDDPNPYLPTFAVESGWTESWPNLRKDMKVWLLGGGGAVQDSHHNQVVCCRTE